MCNLCDVRLIKALVGGGEKVSSTDTGLQVPVRPSTWSRLVTLGHAIYFHVPWQSRWQTKARTSVFETNLAARYRAMHCDSNPDKKCENVC